MPARFSLPLAGRPPGAAAVRRDGRSPLTYAELDARRARLADRLRARGVGPETVVAGSLTDRADSLVALLAVLSAGGVYLPLDTGAPAEHRRDVLTDSGARVELRDGPQPGAEPLLTGRADPPRAGVEPTDANTAYLLYTSGTTGRPKGVCVTRGALAAHVDDMAERLELVPEDRVLWFAAPHVDVAWEQALTPLRVGATVVTRGPGVPTFGELADLVERHAVTVANLPGGYWNGWALALTEQQRTQRRALRLMISGSERMSARAAVNWQRILPDVPLLNAYGPTEAVITSTLFRVPAGLAARDEIPIGTACGSRQLRVLDAELAPVVRGQVGELYVGGGPLAREYLGRPSMTAARFVPDPYADSRGAVMYRTGDLVRENADGDLEFVGRIDDQVKVRGFRVEPAEVRLALERHPAVRHCAVLGRTAPGGPTSLVADPAFWAGDDSLPILRELRQRAPLWHLESATEGPLWCVLSHELAGEVLGDAARFSSERGSLLGTGRDRAPAGAGKMMALTAPPRATGTCGTWCCRTSPSGRRPSSGDASSS
ncbi:amino acid adenylation domain-containing protein [Streptomyces noursei]|uniref:amino acid adenylation domain-containing protein n=1 Tax=Streptomyces noursei TaxID=1971 RepID=UPI0035E27F8D